MFLEYAVDSPFRPCTSWGGFLKPVSSLPSIGSIKFDEFGQLQLEVTDEETFAHLKRPIGPCRICRELPQDIVDGIYSRRDIMVRLDIGGESVCFSPFGIHGVFLADIPYFLVRLNMVPGRYWARAYWAAIEVVEGNGWEPGAVIKWGVFREYSNRLLRVLRLDDAEKTNAWVTYLNGEEARRQSAHTERYMQAFTGMRAKGGTLIFDE